MITKAVPTPINLWRALEHSRCSTGLRSTCEKAAALMPSRRKPGVPFNLTGIHANTESYIFFHTVRLMLSLAAPTRIADSTLSPPE